MHQGPARLHVQARVAVSKTSKDVSNLVSGGPLSAHWLFAPVSSAASPPAAVKSDVSSSLSSLAVVRAVTRAALGTFNWRRRSSRAICSRMVSRYLANLRMPYSNMTTCRKTPASHGLATRAGVIRPYEL